jgi:pimeloyl-ACP methyl ester carboxylesterase
VPPNSAQYESEMGGFRLEIIKEAGHFVHCEYPEETINIVGNFLTRFRTKGPF